jgi:endoglucanase
MHEFLDSDSSDLSDSCVRSTIGSERLTVFTEWLGQHNKRGLLGEFAGAYNSQRYDAPDDMLRHLREKSVVWLG